MGERLNIEITNGERPIANCYYHSSAYTIKAALLTLKALDKYDESAISEVNMRLNAIKMLQNTGGELLQEDSEFFIETYGYNCTQSKEINRHDGLISITEDSMEKTQGAKEAEVLIDLKNKMISFCVFYNSYEDGDDMECFRKNISKKEKLPKLSYDFDEISFEEFPKFYKDLMTIEKMNVTFTNIASEFAFAIIA